MIHRGYYTTTINVGVHFVKQARAIAFAQLIRPHTVSVHLFIFIFLVPVATLQRGGRTAWRDGKQEGVERDRVKLPWIHLAKRTTRFGPVNPPILGVPALPYFLPFPLQSARVTENSSLLQNIIFMRFLEAF